MPNVAGATRAQSDFLRALRDNPSLPPDRWPTPFLFRKWLRRPAFRRALLSLRDADRTRSAYHLARSAAQASVILHAHLLGEPGFEELDNDVVSLLSNLLRLSHSAERLDPAPRHPLIRETRDLRSLSTLHPDQPRVPSPNPQ